DRGFRRKGGRSMARSEGPGSRAEPASAGAGDERGRGTESADERRRLFDAIVENTSDAVLVTDAGLDPPGPLIVYVNPAYTRMTGYTAEDSVGYNPRYLQGHETDRAALARIRVAPERGAPIHEE